MTATHPQSQEQHWQSTPLGLGPMETAIMRVMWNNTTLRGMLGTGNPLGG